MLGCCTRSDNTRVPTGDWVRDGGRPFFLPWPGPRQLCYRSLRLSDVRDAIGPLLDPIAAVGSAVPGISELGRLAQ